MSYKHAESKGWYYFIDHLGNKGQSWHPKDKPKMEEERLKWLADGNMMIPIYTSEELEEKKLEDAKQALESQKQTCTQRVKDIEYRISNHPPYPEDVEKNKAYIDLLRACAASEKVQDIPKDPFG